MNLDLVIFSSYIPVKDFILHSTNVDCYIHYLISLDITKKFEKYIHIFYTKDFIDCKYIYIKSLKVTIHKSLHASIAYKVEFFADCETINFDDCIKLPKIKR